MDLGAFGVWTAAFEFLPASECASPYRNSKRWAGERCGCPKVAVARH